MYLVHFLLGWFVADLLSALFHLLIDSLGESKLEYCPLIGRMIIDFRRHHEEPLNPEFIGDNLLALAPATIMLWITGVILYFLLLPTAGGVFAATVGIGIALSQATHRWSHVPPPPLARWLQKCGLFLSPNGHVGHHNTGRFDRNYGSLNGWSHPLLNFIIRVVQFAHER